jgi:hypothetical protein
MDITEIEKERLPLKLQDVDIANLLKENPTIMKNMFNGHKDHIPLYKCPDCSKTMPEAVKDLHKCKANESGNNNNKTSS